jgi:argininosuccinate synthase
MTKPIKKTPDSTMMITLDFEQGASVALNGSRLNAVSLGETLNELARCHGISVANIVYEEEWFSPSKRALDAFIDEMQ